MSGILISIGAPLDIIGNWLNFHAGFRLFHLKNRLSSAKKVFEVALLAPPKAIILDEPIIIIIHQRPEKFLMEILVMNM